MRLGSTTHQKSRQLELPLCCKGEAQGAKRSGEAPTASNGNERSGNATDLLMEQVVQRANLVAALRRVRRSKGSPGIDGMTVQELPAYLAAHWPSLRASLLDGTYSRSQFAGMRTPRAGEESRSSGFLACSTGSSSKPFCKCCNRYDVMQTLRRLFTGLRLRVNEAKSAVARPWERKFLGHTFWIVKKTGELRLGIASKALKTMKERVRAITSRTGGRSIPKVIEQLRPYLLGWKEYFRLQQRASLFRELDGWIRHRLRMLQLKHWKNGTRAFSELRKLGLSVQDAAKVAGNLRSWWRNSHMALNFALPPSYFDQLGLPRLAA